jgi:hypothetical protein
LPKETGKDENKSQREIFRLENFQNLKFSKLANGKFSFSRNARNKHENAMHACMYNFGMLTYR